MNDVVKQEKPKHSAMTAGGGVKPIIPQDFESAWRIADLVSAAGMAPKGLDRPEQAMVAILHGLEVGMSPMAALQSIAVVNGRPSLWGDGAMALVESSGKLAKKREWIEGTGDGMVAKCELHRNGRSEPVISTFSVEDAKKAGLWSKSGPWQQYPKRMLQMRARAFALRDMFSDVLRGLSIAEEQSDVERTMKDVTPASPANDGPPPPPPEDDEVTEDKRSGAEDVTEDPAGEADAMSEEREQTETDEFDPDAFLDTVQHVMDLQKDEASVEEAWSELDVEATLTHDAERMEVANQFKKAALKRVAKG